MFNSRYRRGENEEGRRRIEIGRGRESERLARVRKRRVAIDGTGWRVC